jgi:hypothetical protein
MSTAQASGLWPGSYCSDALPGLSPKTRLGRRAWSALTSSVNAEVSCLREILRSSSESRSLLSKNELHALPICLRRGKALDRGRIWSLASRTKLRAWCTESITRFISPSTQIQSSDTRKALLAARSRMRLLIAASSRNFPSRARVSRSARSATAAPKKVLKAIVTNSFKSTSTLCRGGEKREAGARDRC